MDVQQLVDSIYQSIQTLLLFSACAKYLLEEVKLLDKCYLAETGIASEERHESPTVSLSQGEEGEHEGQLVREWLHFDRITHMRSESQCQRRNSKEFKLLSSNSAPNVIKMCFYISALSFHF